jgi:hypothetical protein
LTCNISSSINEAETGFYIFPVTLYTAGKEAILFIENKRMPPLTTQLETNNQYFYTTVYGLYINNIYKN